MYTCIFLFSCFCHFFLQVIDFHVAKDISIKHTFPGNVSFLFVCFLLSCGSVQLNFCYITGDLSEAPFYTHFEYCYSITLFICVICNKTVEEKEA